MSNYSSIKYYDTSNGKGIRLSVFFSGCDKRCPGCFNSSAWDYEAGEPFTREVYETKIKPYVNEHIRGLSILGGEPLAERNIDAVWNLISWFKEDFPDKDIWMWSGYTWGDLSCANVLESDPLFASSGPVNKLESIFFNLSNRWKIYMSIDVLVDGPFIQEQKDLTLPFRGSSNQRIIDMKETLRTGEIVEYEL